MDECKPLDCGSRDSPSSANTNMSDYSLGLRGTLSGAARVTAAGASSTIDGSFIVDATVSPAVVSAALTSTLALPGLTASVTVASYSQCSEAGNAVAGWVEIDLPGVVTARVRGAGLQHCVAAAPFRHRLVAAVEGGAVTSMSRGMLQLRGLAVDMRSAATAANAGAHADDPLLAWSGTITGDLQLTFGDPAAGAVSATVTGGASAPFELSLLEKRVSVGEIQVQTDLHVQYGAAAAPMFAADATLQFVVGGAPAPISGRGSLTFRVPLDGDAVATVNMSAALQVFPAGVRAAIRKGRSMVLSGQVAKVNDDDGAAPELFSIGGFAVSGLGVTAVAYTLADRLAHHGAMLHHGAMQSDTSTVERTSSAAGSMTALGVSAVMAAAGLDLAECGVTQGSVVAALAGHAGHPAAIKAVLFQLFFKATSIADQLAAAGVLAEEFTVDAERLIHVLTMFGDSDAAGKGYLAHESTALWSSTIHTF